MTLAQWVGPGLQDFQKQGQRILAARNAEEAKENTWIGWMIMAENIKDMQALVKSRGLEWADQLSRPAPSLYRS